MQKKLWVLLIVSGKISRLNDGLLSLFYSAFRCTRTKSWFGVYVLQVVSTLPKMRKLLLFRMMANLLLMTAVNQYAVPI